MTKQKTRVQIEGVSPEEYAAYWGCDPCYDHPPRNRGDGYHLYNFSSKLQPRNAEYLASLLGAIDRTILEASGKDKRSLGKLRKYVAGLTPIPDDEFAAAYVTAALWASTDDDGDPLDSNYTAGDIHPETMRKIVADCRAFRAANAADIEAVGVGQAGHDYFLTRNHHGAGFWDRGNGEAGERLTKASHAAGEVNFYVGDDGRIYI